MARVAGVDLPREKRGEVAITYIYGIGRSTARRVLLRANMDPSKKVKAWTEDEVGRIRDIIERELKVEGDLRREVSMNVKRLMDIGCYRGSVTGAACRSADSARIPMRAPARARPSRLPARRSNRPVGAGSLAPGPCRIGI